MAHSRLRAAGIAGRFNDADIIAVVCLLREVVRRGTSDLVLDKLVSRWEENLGGYGPGTINLDFSLLRDPDTLKAVRVGLTAVETLLDEMEPLVPQAQLNGLNVVSGVKFVDYRTSLLHEAVQRLIQFLESAFGQAAQSSVADGSPSVAPASAVAPSSAPRVNAGIGPTPESDDGDDKNGQ